MPATNAIKSRISSVKNTRQITKALELVAASKLRKAQDAAKRSAEYAQAARELLSYLSNVSTPDEAPLYQPRPVKNRLYIVVSSDQGQAGAFNSNLFKLLTQRLGEDKKTGVRPEVITIGRKAGQFVARLKGIEVVGSYENFPDEPTTTDLQPIISTAVRGFLEGSIDAVEIIATDYISSVNQVAKNMQLLPAGFDEVEVPTEVRTAEFEPSTAAVLETVTLRLLESQLLQNILASKASEYTMRMMAMHNATDNASGLIDDLTLEMNKARQAYITQELAEITGGAEALK